MSKKNKLELSRHEDIYDSENRIYRASDGTLRDRDDDSFVLPPIPFERETLRRTMFGVVDTELAEDSDFPHAKLTYSRLRLEGASNLEARALMAGAWMDEVHHVITKQIESDDQRLKARLDSLHPAKSG
jgi:hypothetical protein